MDRSFLYTEIKMFLTFAPNLATDAPRRHGVYVISGANDARRLSILLLPLVIGASFICVRNNLNTTIIITSGKNRNEAK